MIEEIFPTPAADAFGHTHGFFVRTAVGVIIGAIIYVVARRRRRPVPDDAEARGE
jgi:hypothetical protein